jgi:2-polyprenyl-3-methyl-5-hydroxy-6-metoxy-1,4-benzoquinol methylase
MSDNHKHMDYYNSNADAFYQGTIDLDVSEFYNRFCSHLKPKARILDAGCGSGRDAQKFMEMGFAVDAFDSSVEMVKLAKERTGIDAELSDFRNYEADAPYDGIWCCASLLHVPFDSLQSVMRKMSDLLKEGGVWYLSFKHGNNERLSAERNFTDLNESALNEIIDAIDGLRLHSAWLTNDVRSDRNDKWLNVLIKKTPNT